MTTDQAEEIPRDCFTRGEIDSDEYARSPAILHGEPGREDRERSEKR